MKVIKNISVPGLKINEDIIYCTENLYVLLDGASGLGENNIKDSKSDAAWYVTNFVNVFSKNYNSSCNIIRNLKDTISSLKTIYDSNSINKDVEPYIRPSATGTIISIQDNVLNIYSLGDIKTIIKFRDNSLEVLQNSGLKHLDDTIFNKTNKNKFGKSISFKESLLDFKDDIKSNRNLMNQPNGYWIFSFDEQAIDNISHNQYDIDNIDEILLMSDGFYTVYNMENHKLFEAINDSTDIELINNIKESLNDDPGYELYNRFKAIDDISLLQIKNDN